MEALQQVIEECRVEIQRTYPPELSVKVGIAPTGPTRPLPKAVIVVTDTTREHEDITAKVVLSSKEPSAVKAQILDLAAGLKLIADVFLVKGGGDEASPRLPKRDAPLDR